MTKPHRVEVPALGSTKGFSNAVVSTSSEIVWLAGQTALNADGIIVGDDIVEQFEVALGRLLASLSSAGGRPEEICWMQIYVTDMEEYKNETRAIGHLWKTGLGSWYPAMALVETQRLWDQQALVELQGIAVVNRESIDHAVKIEDGGV